MHPLKHLAIAVLCVLCAPAGVAAELGVLAPVMVDDEPLMKRDAHDRPAPVVTRVTSGPLFDKLQKQYTTDFVLLRRDLETLASTTDEEIESARLTLFQLASNKDL